jgi:hypothetical protein
LKWTFICAATCFNWILSKNLFGHTSCNWNLSKNVHFLSLDKNLFASTFFNDCFGAKTMVGWTYCKVLLFLKPYISIGNWKMNFYWNLKRMENFHFFR